MENNIFAEIQQKKQKLSELVQKAQQFGWIKEEESQKILSDLQKDVLTIGVIGQMKAGKSTFLNSFVFGDDVLPAATTPMTAALSVITYGEKKEIEAEFYSSEEWQEQLMTSKMPVGDSTDDLKKSKVMAAKELVEKSARLGGSIDSLLGKKQKDTLDNLEQYVGADGKFVSITKAVKVYYPEEYLKGVRIVDTPGFNDPIVSREERTKEFLKEADVVLLMTYAGRPFDKTDSNILFKNVGVCGTGKVIIGINKYDIPYENGETEEEIVDYVKGQIRKSSEDLGDDSLNEILKQTTPISISAEMALLAEMPMSKINGSETYSFEWNRYCDIFEISSQKELLDRSHLNNLVAAVRQVIENEKEKILIQKPLNTIMAKGSAKKASVRNEISKTEELIHNLQAPDTELEEKESKLNRTTKRIDRKINSLAGDLEDVMDEVKQNEAKLLNGAVDRACAKLDDVVDNWGTFSSVDTLNKNLNRITQALTVREIPDIQRQCAQQAKIKTKDAMDSFFNDAEEVLIKLNAFEDFDPSAFVKQVSRKFDFKTSTKSLFSFTDEENSGEYGDLSVTDSTISNIVGFATLGIWTLIKHSGIKDDIKNNVSNLRDNFDGEEAASDLSEAKDKIIDVMEESFKTKLLVPFQEQLDSIRQEGINKQKALEDAQVKLTKLKDDLATIESQIETAKNYK